MKRIIVWVVLLAGVVTTFDSCEEPEPEPIPLIVGAWERDIYVLTELPSTFQNFEGYATESIFGEDSYTLNFTQDKKYTRKISFVGPDANDTGVWTLEGDNLTLDSDDEDIDTEEFEVEEEITANQLIISQINTFSLLPDAVTDTLTAAWANSHQQQLQQYYKDVDAKVLFLFEK